MSSPEPTITKPIAEAIELYRRSVLHDGLNDESFSPEQYAQRLQLEAAIRTKISQLESRMVVPIWLKSEHGDITVSVEINGEWREVIRDRGSIISHIWEGRDNSAVSLLNKTPARDPESE